MSMEVIIHGGETIYSAMTSQVDAGRYSVRKVYAWANMLNDRKRPVLWKKPSKKGTRVRWEMVRTQEEIEMAWDELEEYIHAINKRFGTDFRLNRGPAKDGEQS